MVKAFHDTDVTRSAECERVTYSVARNTTPLKYPTEIQSPTPFFTLRTWANLFIRRSESFTELIKGTLTCLSRVLPLHEYE